jgi:hypothetical protein
VPRSNRPRLAGQLTDFVRRTCIPFFNTQMGKGTVAGHRHERRRAPSCGSEPPR